MVKKNAEEFAGVFVNYLIDIGREVYAFPQVLAKRSFPYKSKTGEEREFIFADKYAIRLYQPPLIYRNILDIRSYQPFLVVLIVKRLLTAKMPKEIEMYVHSLMWYVLRAFGHDKDPGLESQVIPFKRSVERVLDEAMQLVLKPNLTDGERQQILILLTTLRSIL